MNSVTGSQSYACGVNAYRNGNYDFAADCFRVSLQKTPSDWNIQFFLAMSLAQADQPQVAQMHFRHISELCPDPVVRKRAEVAALALKVMKH